jgi:hypothetical protein
LKVYIINSITKSYILNIKIRPLVTEYTLMIKVVGGIRSLVVLFWYSKSTISYTICIHQLEVIFTTLDKKYCTITDFCKSEYEFLLTYKIILTEAEGWGQYWFCRSIKTHIHWPLEMLLFMQESEIISIGLICKIFLAMGRSLGNGNKNTRNEFLQCFDLICN